MKFLKSILTSAFVASTVLTGCNAKAEQTGESDSQTTSYNAPKMIVCYFSATGTTAHEATRISDLTGATLYEITPVERYTDADLDWRNADSRSSVEMHDPSSRPAIVDSLPPMNEFDIVFLGYPNWWNTYPTIINTFIESVDLNGKTIVPFMTSGGSDIANSESQLKATYPELKFANGLLMNGVSDDEIISWVKASYGM